MINTILEIMDQLGIKTWQINQCTTESAEIFMIKKREDIRRAKQISQFFVTVYHDFDMEGKAMRGSSDVIVYPGTSKTELTNKLQTAYLNAGYVKNPFYELADPTIGAIPDSHLIPNLFDAASQMLQALYSVDTRSDVFINSTEIFAEKKLSRILCSSGTDVSFAQYRINGEFIVQAIEPRDVETYTAFDYAEVNTSAISELASQALTTVRDRALAETAPIAGDYDVILTDENVRTVLEAYLQKTNAAMVYPGYSRFQIGTLLNKSDSEGEKLNIRVFSRAPFSEEGIPMPERVLIEDGEVKAILGSARFCRYLGLQPTGSYSCMKVDNGTVSLQDMKKRRCLMPVVFSDFQCDSLRGSFGGEIRLAYLFDENGVTLLTGGSINGSLTQKQDDLIFSKERYETLSYLGPKAVLIPGISVSGS